MPSHPTEPTATAARLLATPEAFRAWLAGKPADEEIGQNCVDHGCPIATFLEAKLGGIWYVGPSPAGLLCACPGHPTFEVPHWVRAFVCQVDERFRRYSQVNAGQALCVLAEIAPEHAAFDRATATGEAQPGQGAQQASEEG